MYFKGRFACYVFSFPQSAITYFIDELPTSNRYVGDISAEGVYYLKGGGTTYYKIDLDPNSNTYTQHLATESLSQNISIHDWAFNAIDGWQETGKGNRIPQYCFSSG